MGQFIFTFPRGMKLLLIILCYKSLIEARLLGFADKLLRSPTLELGPRLANNNNNDLETGAGNGTKKQPDVIQDEGDKICFDKMSIIEETQFDNLETCNHSYQKKCHTTYVTQYQPYQEEECKESFKKSCHLSMEKATVKEQVEVCRTPLVKTCDNNLDSDTEAECKTMYESECWTKYEKHEVDDDVPKCETVNEEKCDASGKCESWPKEVCQIVSSKVVKTTPKSGCDKVPRTMCYTANCEITEGPLECHQEPREVLVDRPVEECGMESFNTCRPVTKLTPSLVPKQTCRDVPRETCSTSKVNPRRVRRPVIRRVCIRKDDDTDTEDTKERRSMGSCYKAPLNAQLHGGDLKWKGSGLWEPSSICVDWYSSNMAWTCETNKASATSWSLVNCRERTPRQKCAEFFR